MGILDIFKKKKVSITVNRQPKQQPQTRYIPGKQFKFYTAIYEEKLKVSQSTTLFWPFEKGIRAVDIEDIKAGCKCTAQISWDDDGVTAVFTNKEKPKDIPPEGMGITKSMRVYYNDGVKKLRSPSGGMVFAPEKFSELLNLTGWVIK